MFFNSGARLVGFDPILVRFDPMWLDLTVDPCQGPPPWAPRGGVWGPVRASRLAKKI